MFPEPPEPIPASAAADRKESEFSDRPSAPAPDAAKPASPLAVRPEPRAPGSWARLPLDAVAAGRLDGVEQRVLRLAGEQPDATAAAASTAPSCQSAAE